MKIVIVGGVAGGASAAARIRRLDERAQIMIFERSGFVSYANCGLPYYIGGTIKDKRALTLQTPQSFFSRFSIDVRVLHEVTQINRERKTITVINLESGESFEEDYDKLILAPGARAIRPDIPNVDSKRIFTLRTVEDTFKINEIISSKMPRSAVVIGGGFVGVEMAENLSRRGINVTLIERQPQLLGQLDADMASFVHAHMKSQGVRLLCSRTVSGFEEKIGGADGIKVLIENEQPVLTDMVILAIGVTPDSALAEKAGLKLGFKNSIAVNEYMQTSDEDIYAVGDAVEITNTVTGEKTTVPLAGPANKQGRIAADNICGFPRVYKGTAGASVVKVFDITAAAVGLNERSAAGIGYEKIILSPASHASYYPGGSVMTLKVIFERKTERILGAQIVGFDGVDKRIDVISTAMQAGMKVSELAELDLAYAPPYSSAKDPVNMAGFIAQNVLDGTVKQFFYEDLSELENEDVILLDTRTSAEYERGHADGFDINIPVDDLRERLCELDSSKSVYVMCQSGLRSYIACRILSQNGFDCYNFAGGYRLYESINKDCFDVKSNTSCGAELFAAQKNI
ncbi:MAG: CoA-disulfide reductase [Clostridia bacterium]|nr:CoA-disulfide reductase [Clostridia bacterium]